MIWWGHRHGLDLWAGMRWPRLSGFSRRGRRRAACGRGRSERPGRYSGSAAGPRGTARAEAVRVAAYAAKLRVALSADAPPFYAASFARDPWATAKALLGWRDQLTTAGWHGRAIGAARIDDLARAEREGPALPAGTPDRLCGVMAALADRPGLSIASLRLVEPRAMLSPPTAGSRTDLSVAASRFWRPLTRDRDRIAI